MWLHHQRSLALLLISRHQCSISPPLIYPLAKCQNFCLEDVHISTTTFRLIYGASKLFGQTSYHGAWSTLFASTSPSLSGMGHAYIGPNILGMVRFAVFLAALPDVGCSFCTLLPACPCCYLFFSQLTCSTLPRRDSHPTGLLAIPSHVGGKVA